MNYYISNIPDDIFNYMYKFISPISKTLDKDKLSKSHDWCYKCGEYIFPNDFRIKLGCCHLNNEKSTDSKFLCLNCFNSS